MKQLYVVVVSAIVIQLGGCGSVPDYSEFYQQYEQEFTQQLNYSEHKIPRSDGYHIVAREFGVEHKNIQPTIVMMHGFPDSLHAYDQLVLNLADRHHIVSFDFVGWGKSDKPVNHNYDASSLLIDLDTVIRYYSPGKVTLVVHDLSGFPGIDWALDHASRVHAMVLLNTVYSPSKVLVSPDYIERFATPGWRRELSVFLTRHFDHAWYSIFTDQVAKFIVNESARNRYLKIFTHQSYDARTAFYSANRSVRTEVANRATRIGAMQNFQPPVLVIFGEEDTTMNSGVAREFATQFPNTSLHLIKNAGHHVHLDHPQQVAKLINVLDTGFD